MTPHTYLVESEGPHPRPRLIPAHTPEDAARTYLRLEPRATGRIFVHGTVDNTPTYSRRIFSVRLGRLAEET